MSAEQQVIVSSKRKRRTFVLWATVFAFLVSFFFIYNSFENYYAFTDGIEQRSSISDESGVDLAPREDVSTQDPFEQIDFALIGGIMFAIMGILASLPLIVLARLNRHLAVDVAGKRVLVSREDGAPERALSFDQIAAVRSDDVDFTAEFDHHDLSVPEHEHDLLITLTSGKLVKVTCPNHREAERAARELIALLPELPDQAEQTEQTK